MTTQAVAKAYEYGATDLPLALLASSCSFLPLADSLRLVVDVHQSCRGDLGTMRAPSSRLLFMVPVICLLFSVCFVQTAPLARHKNNRKFGTGNGQAFVSSLVRKLGLVDFYTNLYRGVRSTFLVGRDSERTKSNNGGSHTYNSHAYSVSNEYPIDAHPRPELNALSAPLPHKKICKNRG